MPEPEIIEEQCFGCFCCTVVCPRGVLISPEIGMIPLIVTPWECTSCKRCIDECPFDAIKIKEEVTVSS
jgi:NAD-dependent dihydropyrimidine dehydrogenase PreA subunit